MLLAYKLITIISLGIIPTVTAKFSHLQTARLRTNLIGCESHLIPLEKTGGASPVSPRRREMDASLQPVSIAAASGRNLNSIRAVRVAS